LHIYNDWVDKGQITSVKDQQTYDDGYSNCYTITMIYQEEYNSESIVNT
jgi:hypothetical protein